MKENFENQGVDITNVPEANQAEYIQQIENADVADEHIEKGEFNREFGRKTMIKGAAGMAVGGIIPVVGHLVQAFGAGTAAVGAYIRHTGNKELKEGTQDLEEALDAAREQVLPLESIDIEAAHREMERAQQEGDTEEVQRARNSVNQVFDKIKFEGQG